jgi:hypothetical protein
VTTSTMIAAMSAALRLFPAAASPDWAHEIYPDPRPLSHRPYGGYLPERGWSALRAVHICAWEFIDAIFAPGTRASMECRIFERDLKEVLWALGEKDLWRELNRVAADDYPQTAVRALLPARNAVAAALKPIRDAERRDQVRQTAQAMAAIASVASI